jgi:hypothetical protein
MALDRHESDIIFPQPTWWLLGGIVVNEDDHTPSTAGFSLMIILALQGLAWFAIGLGTGYALWH